MAPLTYAAPSYSLGSTDMQATKAKAEASFRGMQGSLKKWLRFRNATNGAALGKPAEAIIALRQDRFRTEQALANSLHALLVECGASATSLPGADVAADADAAARLAELVILGKCPSQVASAPTATGLIWWVIAIPVAGAALIVSQYVRGQSELAMEQERLRCVKEGTCTDEGFWVKWASIAVLGVIGWRVWEAHGKKKA